MADHLGRRRAFGKRLGEFQHWQFKLAEYATDIETARNLYLKAALRLDSGVPFPEPEAAMAKLRGTALAVDIARDAIQVLGGYGFARELGADNTIYRAEAIYRDAKIGERSTRARARSRSGSSLATSSAARSPGRPAVPAHVRARPLLERSSYDRDRRQCSRRHNRNSDDRTARPCRWRASAWPPRSRSCRATRAHRRTRVPHRAQRQNLRSERPASRQATSSARWHGAATAPVRKRARALARLELTVTLRSP